MWIRMRSKSVSRVLTCALLVAAIGRSSPALAQDDSLSAYRERFKAGLERYQAGQNGEAIQYWEPIYRELGAERGFRLAFNLARAYENFGDATRAVERYESFLAQVRRKRERGEAIEPLIEKESEQAQQRIDDLAKTRGRITIASGATPIAVRIDDTEPRIAGFTAYVAPGVHGVVFSPNTADETRHSVTVNAGERVELAAPPPHADVAPSASAANDPRTDPSSSSRPASSETRVQHPIPSEVLWIGAGATALSVIAPIFAYRSASSFRDANKLSGDSTQAAADANARIRSDYDAHATTYYATLALPIALGAATTALGAWYFFGARSREVPVVVPSKDGASIGFWRRF